jgi:uncharacterized protein
MIQEFYVENFMSFGDRQYVSFLATTDKSYLEELTVEVKSGVRLLKTAIIYGSNASGKSNLLFAIETLWDLLYAPRDIKSKSIPQYRPFALKKGESSKLGLTFFIEDVKYTYEIEYNQNTVLYEKLEYVKKVRKALFYERSIQDGITFGEIGLSRKSINLLKANTLDNHTVLSSFAKTKIDDKDTEYERLYRWIEANVHEIGHQTKLIDIAKEAKENQNLKNFIKTSLSVSDFNIVDFDVVEKIDERTIELKKKIDTDNTLTQTLKEELFNSLKEDLEFIHKTSKNEFSLSVKDESAGTIQFFGVTRKIYDLLKNDCIYLIDELEDSLHYDLMLHLLLRFIRNSSHSQLIFSTHNILLLDEDFIRRDMVKLVEKSRETAETQVYSASDFKLHKKLSLFNAYKIGKFGAKPVLGSTLIARSEN